MTPTHDDIVAMERCHVKAWPAFFTKSVHGWHWRYSGGVSQRANSVSTVDFDGSDPEAALNEIEALYRAKGVPTRFQVYDLTQPVDLEDRLRARGYQQSESTRTMFKRPERQEVPADTQQYNTAISSWTQVYMGEITESRRIVNAQIGRAHV